MSSNTNKYKIVITLSLLLFIEMFDASALYTSLPTISSSLQVPLLNSKLSITSYFLTLGIFIPTSGWLADKYGERRIILLAIIIFSIGSLGCSISSTLYELVLFRVVQGIGGSFMMPIARRILVRVFSGYEMVKAMNVLMPLSLMGLVTGPAIGGFISSSLSWRYIFYINIPIGILFYYCLHRTVPNIVSKACSRFDIIGFILFSCSIFTVLLVDFILFDYNISRHTKILLASASIFLMFFYVKHSRKCPSPILNLNVFNNTTFSLAAASSVLARLVTSSIPYLVALMLQMAYHYSAFKAGYSIVPIALGMICIRVISYRIISFFGYRFTIISTSLLLASVMILWSTLQIINHYVFYILSLFFYGSIISILLTSIDCTVYEQVSDGNKTTVISLYSTILQISQCIGISISTFTLRYSLFSSGRKNLSFYDFHNVFMLLAIFSVLIIVLICFLPRSCNASHSRI